MTKPLSLRAQPALIAAIGARATQLGLNRSKHILPLVEQYLSREKARRRHRFASRDLIGCVSTGLKSGDNATVRKLIRRGLNKKNR